MTAVAAQSDAIQKRNALMKSMWKDGFGAPYRMANGKEPFDQAKAEAGLAKMAEIVAAPQFGCKSRHQIQLIDKNLGQQARLRGKAGELTKSIAESRGKAKDVDGSRRSPAPSIKTARAVTKDTR